MIPSLVPTIKTPTPRLIPSLATGFNVVANHIWVILLPIFLDIMLWFGPRLRISELLRPILDQWFADLSQTDAVTLTQSMTVLQTNVQQLLEGTNLFGSLSGFPIGIPSLISSSGFMNNPSGQAQIYELANPASAIFAWLLITVFGIILGSLYFNSVSRISASERLAFSLPTVVRQTGQSLVLVVTLLVAVIFVAVPLFLIASIFVMIAPFTAQISLTLAFFVGFWLLLPLFFCPHGIFVFQQNALSSITTSRRIVRAFLPGVTLFILASILLTYGLDSLWLSAPDTSWLSLIGIAGHAFISTGILAASFIYYRTGIQWLQEYMQKVATLQTRSKTS